MAQPVYAIQPFRASQFGQVSIMPNTRLELLNDDHWFWWYVRVCDTQEMGYVPFEAVEFPNERLARENRQRNLRAAEQHAGDFVGAASPVRMLSLKHVHFEHTTELEDELDELELRDDSELAPELYFSPSSPDSSPESSPMSSPRSSPGTSPLETRSELLPSRSKLVKLLRLV